MSSPAQIIANKNNAAHSTGPRTQAGRDTSGKNATRHGLTGIFTPLPYENREEFEQIATTLRDEFSPDGENETFLVNEMIQARCRMLRVQRLEDHAFEQILTEPGSSSDPDARILAAMNQSGNILDKLQRYRAAASRSYYKALRELQTARLQSRKTEAKALDTYIEQYIYAPLPGQNAREVAQSIAGPAKIQNEPNPAPTPRPRRADYPENLALCL